MRYLAPSEIELWELARAARPKLPWFDDLGDGLAEFYAPDAAFIRGASPKRTSALLETLEKTREALAETAKRADAMIVRVLDQPNCVACFSFHGDRPHLVGGGGGGCELMQLDAAVDVARALLAGFKEPSGE
ncbi:MAG: hypothetical protein NUW01_11705 [Gemmatimonadaceae bacterium]|nr:hypothetical protein [Gemmatimonadaceae bacterium]